MRLEDFFLPTPKNNHTPHLLQKVAMGFMLALVCLSFGAVNLQSLLWTSSNWLLGAVLPAVVVDKTNAERVAHATTPLKRSAMLDEAARLKAEHMASEGYFAHYSPGGVSPWHWFSEVDYAYAHAGENLAVHFDDSAKVVSAWMDSPTHRDNIINGTYTEIGVGTARGTYQGFDTVFVVQLFGTPAASQQPPVEVLAPSSAVTLPEVGTSSPIFVNNERTSLSADTNPSLNEEVLAATSESPAEPVLVADADTAQTRYHESFMATSSGLLPVTIENNLGGTTAAQATAFGSLITSPSKTLQLVYLFFGTIVAILLSVSVILSVRQARPVQVAYGVALLFVMSGLFYVQALLSDQVAIAANPNDYAEEIISP